MIPFRSITMDFELSAEHPVRELGLKLVCEAHYERSANNLGFIDDLYG